MWAWGRRRIFLYAEATDMRKGFDGLSGLVRSSVGERLMSGDMFVFMNRRKDKVKILYWDGDGFVLYYKRLERGTFQVPSVAGKTVLEVDRTTLLMLLEGVEIQGLKRRKRYRRSA